MPKDVANNSGGGRRGLPRQAAKGNRLCITVSEAAEMLGISRGLGYEAARTGQIPTLRIGRRIVVPVARLKQMLGVNEESGSVAAGPLSVLPSADVEGEVPGEP